MKNETPDTPKRKRGRPKGSKNKLSSENKGLLETALTVISS